MNSSDEEEEDGEWHNGEWMGSGSRRPRRQTKEEQLYGVFGNFNHDNHYQRRSKKSLTAGIQFHSSGIYTVGDDDDNAEKGEGGAGAASAAAGVGAGAKSSKGDGTGAGSDDDDDDFDDLGGVGARVVRQFKRGRRGASPLPKRLRSPPPTKKKKPRRSSDDDPMGDAETDDEAGGDGVCDMSDEDAHDGDAVTPPPVEPQTRINASNQADFRAGLGLFTKGSASSSSSSSSQTRINATSQADFRAGLAALMKSATSSSSSKANGTNSSSSSSSKPPPGSMAAAAAAVNSRAGLGSSSSSSSSKAPPGSMAAVAAALNARAGHGSSSSSSSSKPPPLSMAAAAASANSSMSRSSSGTGDLTSTARRDLPTSFSSAKPPKSAMKKSSASSDEPMGFVRREKDFGKFEKHTKGFGAKMLAKWGFKGLGLGKNLQGRAAPVVANVRPARKGIDFDGVDRMVSRTEEAKRAQGLADAESSYDAEDRRKARKRQREIDEQRRREIEAGWRKPDPFDVDMTEPGDAKPPASRKRVYMTAEELIRSKSRKKGPNRRSAASSSGGSFGKTELVMDFTQSGDGKSIHLHDAMSAAADVAHASVCPELQHNVGKIVETVEMEILNFDTRMQRVRSNTDGIKRERDEMDARLKREREQIQRTKELVEILDELSARLSEEEDTNWLPGDKPKASEQNGKVQSLDDIAEVFEKIQTKYRKEYVDYGVCSVAVSAIFPRIRKALRPWKPLEDPSGAESLLKRWRYLLSSSLDGRRGKQKDVFSELVDKVVIPKIRTAMHGAWQVASPDSARQCVALFASLRECLPTNTVSQLLEALVIPKLTHAIEQWKPAVEATNLRRIDENKKAALPSGIQYNGAATSAPARAHEWLSPWFESLRDELQPVCELVYRKICDYIRTWKSVSDHYPYLVLKPWLDLKTFSDSQTRMLVKNLVMPTLKAEMDAYQFIHPEQQDFLLFERFFVWEPLLDDSQWIRLFEKFYFPKFHTVLHHWLQSAEPGVFAQVAAFYELWNGYFSERLLSHKRFLEQLNVALDMMNCVVLKMKLPALEVVLESAKAACERIPLEKKQTKRPQGPMTPGGLDAANNVLKSSRHEHAEDERSGRRATFDEDDDMGMRFKETVATYAAMKNITFMPHASLGRYHGKQIYKYGKHNIYLDPDHKLIYVKKGHLDWKPVTFTDLDKV